MEKNLWHINLIRVFHVDKCMVPLMDLESSAACFNSDVFF